jgi:hypothetical protein
MAARESYSLSLCVRGHRTSADAPSHRSGPSCPASRSHTSARSSGPPRQSRCRAPPGSGPPIHCRARPDRNPAAEPRPSTASKRSGSVRMRHLDDLAPDQLHPIHRRENTHLGHAAAFLPREQSPRPLQLRRHHRSPDVRDARERAPPTRDPSPHRRGHTASAPSEGSPRSDTVAESEVTRARGHPSGRPRPSLSSPPACLLSSCALLA